MKRNAYIILCLIAIGLLGYTAYYAYSHIPGADTPALATSTSTPSVATTTELNVEEKNTFSSLTSGKKIKLVETNPNGESLSTITITPIGFTDNTSVVLETNKMATTSFIDLNNDSYEELIIITMAQGSGSYGEAYIFTTASNTVLVPVPVPEIGEEDTKKGGLFEGYMGHDSFAVVNGHLERTFPTYTNNDSNSNPTGPIRTITYSVVEKNGVYNVTFTKNTTTSTVLPLDKVETQKKTTIVGSSTRAALPPPPTIPSTKP